MFRSAGTSSCLLPVYFLLICLPLLLHKKDAGVWTVTAWPQKMFSQLQMPLSLLSADQPVLPPVKCFKLLSKDFRAHSFTPAGTDADAEVLSYISASQTYAEDESPAFWNSTSAFPSLVPFAQDLLATPASQVFVERVFRVCGHLTSGKRDCLCKKLASKAFLEVKNKFYDWLCLTVEHCVMYIIQLKLEVKLKNNNWNITA